MIEGYKKVSVIYGQGGRECALRIHENMERLHFREGMPVVSYLLAEELLSSEDIVNRVREILSFSDQCIILLTFDDADGTRVRQNVLIEIGMALVMIGREKCFVVSERPFLPDDFPSDIRGALNLNCMEIRETGPSADRITAEIVEKLKLKTHSGILKDQKYVYDYMKVLEDVPGSVFEEKPDLQLSHILDVWLNQVRSFTFTEERICYILERVIFLPIFPGGEKLRNFLSGLKDAVRTEVRDFTENETQELITGRTIVMRILEYLELRQPFAFRAPERMLRYEYERIARELEECIARLDRGEIEINWYMQIAALDYAALARMHAAAGSGDTGYTREKLQTGVIDPLLRVEDTIARFCPRASELWSGYVSYNLSRAYERMLSLAGRSEEVSEQQREEWIGKIRFFSQRAVSLRLQWIQNGMRGVFSTALSFEYFLAVKHEYELCEKIPGYAFDSPEKRTEEIRQTLAELSVFCRTTGLEKLFDIKESFETMIRRLS